MRTAISASQPLSHVQLIKNDRCKESCLSKIAHMKETCESRCSGSSSSVSVACLSQPRCTDFGDVESVTDVRVRQSEFVSTIEADLVGPAFDREHATQMTVMTAKRKLDHPINRVHRSWSRLRSELPLPSSQFSKVVMLALASAIEQSAAP
jgi:hypothetical protein